MIPSTIEHVGVQWSIHRRDSFIAGFEYLAQKAFRYLGVSGIPAAQVPQLQRMLLDFNVAQLGMCARLLTSIKNYRGAYEFNVRLQANGRYDVSATPDLPAFLAERASIQGLIENFEAISVLDELAIYGVGNPDRILERAREQRPALPIRVLTTEALPRIPNPERIMVLIGEKGERERLLAAGFMPGLIIDERDLERLFLL